LGTEKGDILGVGGRQWRGSTQVRKSKNYKRLGHRQMVRPRLRTEYK